MARYFTFDRIPGNETTLTIDFTSNGDAFDRIVVTATGGNAEYKMQYRKASTQELLTVAVGTPFDDPTAVFTDIIYATIYIPGAIDAETDEFLSANGRYDVVYFSGVVVLREMPYLDEYAPSHPEWAANFVSAGKAFTWIMIADLSNTQSIQYLTSENTASIAYTVSEGWQPINSNPAEASRTLDFGDTPQIIGANLYTWLQENKEGGEEPTTVISGLRKWNAFPSLTAAEQDVAFTSRGTQFSSMRFVEGADEAAGIYYGNTQVFSVVSGWVNEDYRAFDFGATEQRVLASFYDEVIASSFEAATISGEWLWNSLISVTGYSSFIEPLLFTSNGQSFTSLQLSSTSLDYIGASNAVAAAYEDGLQTHERRFDERYRVMNIVGVQVIAKTVYNFISARASGVRPISGTWRFVSAPSIQSIVGQLHFSANYISNGQSFTGMTAVYGGITYTGETDANAYNGTAWTADAFRIIDFGAEQWISEQGYLWFTQNANVLTESMAGFYVINESIADSLNAVEGVYATCGYKSYGYAAAVTVSGIRVVVGNPTKVYYTISKIAEESGTRPEVLGTLPAEVEVFNNNWKQSSAIFISSGTVNNDLRLWLSTNATPMQLTVGGTWEIGDRIAPLAGDPVSTSFFFFSNAANDKARYTVTEIVRREGSALSLYVSDSSEPRDNIPGWIDVYDLSNGWTEAYGDGIQIWEFGDENVEHEVVIFSLLLFAEKLDISSRVIYGTDVLASLFPGQTAIVKCANNRMKDNLVVQAYGSPPYRDYTGNSSSGATLKLKDKIPLPPQSLLSALPFETGDNGNVAAKNYIFAKGEFDVVDDCYFAEIGGEIIFASVNGVKKSSSSIKVTQYYYIWNPHKFSQIIREELGAYSPEIIAEATIDTSFLDQGIVGWYGIVIQDDALYFVPFEESASAEIPALSADFFEVFVIADDVAKYLESCVEKTENIVDFSKEARSFDTKGLLCTANIVKIPNLKTSVILFVEGLAEGENVALYWQYENEKGWRHFGNGLHTVDIPTAASFAYIYPNNDIDVDVVSNGEDFPYTAEYNIIGEHAKFARDGLTYIVRKRG